MASLPHPVRAAGQGLGAEGGTSSLWKTTRQRVAAELHGREVPVGEGISKKNFRTYSKFFRDIGPYDIVINEVLWEIGKAKAANSSRRIQAWSVGCSAGEECNSLILAWEQALRQQFLVSGGKL